MNAKHRLIPPPHNPDLKCSFVQSGWCPYCCGDCEHHSHHCPDCGVPLDHNEHNEYTGKLHPVCGGYPNA